MVSMGSAGKKPPKLVSCTGNREGAGAAGNMLFTDTVYQSEGTHNTDNLLPPGP